jgi:alkylated DNA repair dioxygenase AlkB
MSRTVRQRVGTEVRYSVGSMSADLTINRSAAVRRVALGDHSWVDIVDGFARNAGAEFTDLHGSTAWMQAEVLRYDRYIPEQRLGAGLRSDARPLLRQTELHLNAAYRAPLTGVGAVLYRSGDDFQGLHRDRQLRWLDDTLIAIVVLGQRRPFVLRPRVPLAELTEKIPAGTAPDDMVLLPGEGDLIVMGGASQQEYLHGVPRADTANARISLTWRWTSRRGQPDTAPGYYDGRQYSDRPRQPGTRRRP